MNQRFIHPATDKAAAFHALHRDYHVMPTIWDSLSALAAQAAGFKAVATSSAAFGQALGIRASERVPFDVVEARLTAITATTPLPVSIDMEDGYPEVDGGIDASIRRIIAAGVIAANIEDSWHGHARPLASADDHARRIAQARKAADAELPRFFINGRTDLFLQNDGVEPEVSVAEAVRRAKLYIDAGADGIYVTAKDLTDDVVAELASSIPAPLTVVLPDGRDFSRWGALGVKRGSLGTAVIRNAFHAITTQLSAIRDTGAIPALPRLDLDAEILRGRQGGDRK